MKPPTQHRQRLQECHARVDSLLRHAGEIQRDLPKHRAESIRAETNRQRRELKLKPL